MDYKIIYRDGYALGEKIVENASGCHVDNGALVIENQVGRPLALFSRGNWERVDLMETDLREEVLQMRASAAKAKSVLRAISEAHDGGTCPFKSRIEEVIEMIEGRQPAP